MIKRKIDVKTKKPSVFINIDELTIEFNDFVDEIVNLGKSRGLEIHVMHEDIFNLMHKI